MKQRHLRAGDELSDDEMVVVRGGALDRALLRTDAVRYFSIYGTYGVSVFAAKEITVDELAQEPPLVRFQVLTLIRVGDLRSSGLRLEPRATLTMKADMEEQIDLQADLNAQDDDGLGWSVLADARDPDRIRPGAMLLAGNQAGVAVVRVVAVDEDGQVHFAILPGSIAKNRHLLGGTVP